MPLKRKSGPPASVLRTPSMKPGCVIHEVTMNFDSSLLVWACPMSDCAQIALPRQDIEDGKGKPTVGKGQLDILVMNPDSRSPRYFIRAQENNVLLDVTDYVMRSMDDSDGIEFFMHFTNYTEVEEP